jgi:hypothetical protein
MSRTVDFRPIARIEFDEAMAWYEAHRPGLALEFKEQVDQLLARIADNPARTQRV